ncbi:MAG: SAM-dependent methyltransferase, partial [Candidatus Gastranaerophilales bacterium]|nr:SAM-dependent methyltransferase [Candidatus Gastranaerophilales bacterium]
DLLKEGKTFALVSDAGTPLICDPGSILVEELRKNSIKITSLPGACVIPTFLSQIPKKGEDFAFVGFLPKKEGQIFALLQKFAHTNLVFYESPNRLLKTLGIIKEFHTGTKIAVGRELTKVFEEIIADEVEEVIEYFKKNVLKGEIVVMVYKQEGAEFSQTEILEKINLLKQKKFGTKDISTILATFYDINKNDVYNVMVKSEI